MRGGKWAAREGGPAVQWHSRPNLEQRNSGSERLPCDFHRVGGNNSRVDKISPC